MFDDKITQQFNTLTNDQFQQFIENYAERMVEDMDTKCLEQFVYDTLVENLSIQSPEAVLENVSHTVDDEIIQELLESVTV